MTIDELSAEYRKYVRAVADSSAEHRAAMRAERLRLMPDDWFILTVLDGVDAGKPVDIIVAELHLGHAMRIVQAQQDNFGDSLADHLEGK